jgi:hypothetical protein
LPAVAGPATVDLDVDRQDREHLRYAHEAAITLYLPGELVGDVGNVSRGGLCATLWQPIAVGNQLEVDLQLVFPGERQSEALRLPARVAWCTALDDSYQLGLQFLPLPEPIVADLTMFLRYLLDRQPPPADDPPPALPRAAARSIDDRFG